MLLRMMSLGLFLFSFILAFGKEDFNIESQPIALQLALQLPQQGTLKQKGNGFVYLDVSNEFITAIAPLLEMPGQLSVLPTAKKSLGAHISVFQENEQVAPILNTLYNFQVKEIRSAAIHTRDGLKKLWMIAVHSPELENLRQSYGVSPKLKGHDFHITLGRQLPTAPANWEKVDQLAAENFSQVATLPFATKGDFKQIDHPEILATASKVHNVGQLCLKKNGFAYLNVSNEYIDHISQQLPTLGSFKPLSTKPKQMGAHISVFYEDELIGKEIWELSEAGQLYQFEVKELRYFDRKTTSGYKRTWLLAIDAPALQRLRLKYGLKAKLQGHDFHITLGSEEIEMAQEAA